MKIWKISSTQFTVTFDRTTNKQNKITLHILYVFISSILSCLIFNSLTRSGKWCIKFRTNRNTWDGCKLKLFFVHFSIIIDGLYCWLTCYFISSQFRFLYHPQTTNAGYVRFSICFKLIYLLEIAFLTRTRWLNIVSLCTVENEPLSNVHYKQHWNW